MRGRACTDGECRCMAQLKGAPIAVTTGALNAEQSGVSSKLFAVLVRLVFAHIADMRHRGGLHGCSRTVEWIYG